MHVSFIFPFQMLLHLFSDANYNLLGFNATYTFSLCPGACGGHGRCDSSTLKCHCQQGWGGTACISPLCSETCSVNGLCDKVRMNSKHLPPMSYVHEILKHCLSVCIISVRKENVVCVSQGLWVRTASLVWMMTVEQGSGGVSVREIHTYLPGQVLLACISLLLNHSTCLGVRMKISADPMTFK